MQSPTEILEAYTRDSVVPQTPAGRTWFLVNFKSRPFSVMAYMKVASSLLAPWGMKTTSEKRASPFALAANTRSPTRTEDIALKPPDSSVKVSDPAKQSFDDEEDPEPDTEAIAPVGNLLGDDTEGTATGDDTEGTATGDGTEGAALGDAEGIGTDDVDGTLAPPVM